MVKKIVSILWLYCALLPAFLKKIFKKKSSKNNILIINHHFDQDIRALHNANINTSIYIYELSAYVLNFIFRRFLKPSKDEWYSFYNDNNVIKREAYVIFFNKFISPIFQILKIKLFATPSDLFPYLRDIIPILKKRGIVTVVLDKEGTISPYYIDYYSKEIKENYPFISDFLIVWSLRQKIFWKKAGVNSNNIYICGQARSDFWFKKDIHTSLQLPRKLKNGRKTVLFFSFDKNAYIPESLYLSGEVSWDILFQEAHEVFFNVTNNFPDVNFIIKTHPQQKISDIKYIKDKASIHSNVFVYEGAKLSNNLIYNSDIIIGFQTTALIEAMIVNKPIIYIFWGDAVKWKDNLIPFHDSGALYVANSCQNFYLLVTDMINEKYNFQEDKTQILKQKEFVEEYMYQCNGESALRTLKTIEHLLNAH